MDNLSAHKDAAAIRAIEAAGATVYFLPRYCPEFNPIEKLWAKLKEFVRRAVTGTRELFDNAVAQAMDTISLEDIAAWYEHCGYKIASD